MKQKHKSAPTTTDESENKTLKGNASKDIDNSQSHLLDMTDADSSDADAPNINKFGANKTRRWNRPKIDVSVKDMEKAPTRRSSRIYKLNKEKCETQVKNILHYICGKHYSKYSICMTNIGLHSIYVQFCLQSQSTGKSVKSRGCKRGRSQSQPRASKKQTKRT